MALAMAIRAGLAHASGRSTRMTTLPLDDWNDLVGITSASSARQREAGTVRPRAWRPTKSFRHDLPSDRLGRLGRPAAPPSSHRQAAQRSGPVSRPRRTRERIRRRGLYKDETEFWVTTEPIELEGIALGRFEIRFNWLTVADERPYRVVALDPNPASRSADTTHPHVQYERLCEGDGARAIHQALQGLAALRLLSPDQSNLAHVLARTCLRRAVRLGRASLLRLRLKR